MKESKLIEKALFEAARNFPDPATRSAFLDQTCQGTPQLRERLEKLLQTEEMAEGFFDPPASQLVEEEVVSENIPLAGAVGKGGGSPLHPAVQSASAESNPVGAPNWVIDRYRLVERLGEGGCGVVYLAEQQQPVRRKVALKIIRLGMDTERVIARFELERQALALMNHPHIAQVLDAGATESGRLYFVMELVQGVKITDYCNQHRLNIPQRLDLFIKVCLAIQHAHQKGILHRDIKPSNILITEQEGSPVPKVIDFGIAKAFEGHLAETTLTTNDQFIGTPAYMSPEQAETNGRDVDTRTDIYSLGALLYELLAGRPPFDSKQLIESGLDEMRRILRYEEPLHPSGVLLSLSPEERALIASCYQTEPLKLIASLRGDLDWIVVKALEKDRQRRYATANGLAADIKRYLDNEPVVARPPSARYRLRKLVQRNRTTFAGLFAVAIALMIGTTTSTWLFIRERKARQQEARLRAEAEASEKITQAVFLSREGNLEAANAVLEKLGKPPLRPSLDGVLVYRSVGNWLAINGRWKEAKERFAVLLNLNRLDIWGPVTLDYQSFGVCLMENADTEGYARFCQKSAADFASSRNADAASRILKTCLLEPLSQERLALLQPLGRATERWVRSQPPKAWSAIPASLWWYRCGDFDRAAQCSRKAFEGMRNLSAREATVRLIYAMATFRNGHPEEAQARLEEAREMIEQAYEVGFSKGDDTHGFWYDWGFARLLLREATVLIGL